MVFMTWIIGAAVLAVCIELLVFRGNARVFNPHRRSFFAGAVMSGFATWWLLDVPGMIRFVRTFPTGDEAVIVASQPHPIIEPSGVVLMSSAAILMLFLGVGLVLKPEQFAAGDPQEYTETHLLRRLRIWGAVVIGLVAVSTALLLGLSLLG